MSSSELRRRKPNIAEGQSSTAGTTAGTSSGNDYAPSAPAAASHSKRQSSRASPSRTRVAAAGIPLLLLWYMVFGRKLHAKEDILPPHFAVCSHPGSSPQIWTVDPEMARTECIVIKDGIIADVGSRDQVRIKWGDVDTFGSSRGGIRIRYLKKGQMMLPGLIDAHAHMLQYGESVHSVNLVGSRSVKEIIDRIAKYIEETPGLDVNKERFILGLGWDQTLWPGGAFPTASDLESDPRLSGRPIYLKRVDVHALWVSENILARLHDLPTEVSGGLIVRFPSGQPTGIFVDNAQDLVMEVVPAWTDEDRMLFLRTTARKMLDVGLTGVHDASLYLPDIEFLKKIDKEGRLPIRIYGMTSCEPMNSWCGDQVERYDGDRFTLRAVKLFVDGALGSWGAAMHEPYSNNPQERGIMISPEATFKPLIRRRNYGYPFPHLPNIACRLLDQGFQVASHGIGDRANTVILDAYEAVLSQVRGSDLRLRIEHAQIMMPTDIERAARLGIIASFQPTHATSDMSYAEKRIGPERIKGAYAWQSLIANGSRVALGSDFPVEAVDPLRGIYAAVSRSWLNGDSPHGSGGWFPAEKMTLSQAIRGFTIDAAYAAFQEEKVGSLEVGKVADLVVFDRDFEDIAFTDIPGAKVEAVVVGGKLFTGKL